MDTILERLHLRTIEHTQKALRLLNDSRSVCETKGIPQEEKDAKVMELNEKAMDDLSEACNGLKFILKYVRESDARGEITAWLGCASVLGILMQCYGMIG